MSVINVRKDTYNIGRGLMLYEGIERAVTPTTWAQAQCTDIIQN